MPDVQTAVTASARATMRAAVLRAPQQIQLEDVPVPEPGPGQVRVRMHGCGVCASNVPVWEGREWFSYPLAPGSPGHEGWGTIDAVGDQVEGLQEGQLVGVISENAFAGFDVVDAGNVVVLPSECRGTPFPAEPLGCAENVMTRSRIARGETVAIVGIGFLGALLVQLCRAAGARVIAISRRDSALEQARDWGAEETVSTANGTDVRQRVAELTDGNGCDCVIEVTGYQQPLDLAGDLVRVRGRLVIAGYHQDGLRQVNMQSWNWRGIDVINAHERDPEIYVQGMQAAVEHVRDGTLDVAPLLTHVLPLDELDVALEVARQRPEGFVKAIVTMDE